MLFFRREKPKNKEKQKIHYSELKERFDSLVSIHLEDFEEQARQLFSEIEEAKSEVRKNISILENAKLMNENISIKEKHFMEGNRATYIKVINLFLEDVTEPEQISVSEIENFIKNYEDASKTFIKASFRASQIINNFFGAELSKIKENLKRIDENVKNLAELLKNENIQNIYNAEKNIKKLLGEIEKREQLLGEIEKEEINYENIKNEKAEFERKIIAIKKRPSFVKMNELKEKLKEIEDETKIMTADFVNNFLQIEKALKKFPKSNEQTEKLITHYLEDPVSAVLNDYDLIIVDIIYKVNEMLKNNEIEIEEKKKEKIMQKIASINKMTFTNFIIRYNDLQLKKSEITRLLKQNDSQRELDDLQYRLNHFEEKQKRSMEKIRKLDSQIEAIKIEETKEEIEKAMESVGVPISIEISHEENSEK